MTKWLPSEIDTLKKHYGVIPVRDIMSKLPGRTWDSVGGKAKRLGLVSSIYRRKSSHSISPSDLPQTDDLSELWDAITTLQSASLKQSTRLDHVDTTINISEPIAVGFLADVHIGALTCKYTDFLNRFDAIVNTPNFYLFSVGDTIDNYLPGRHPSGMFAQLVPPELQKQLIEDVYSKMRGRWLGMVQGCHAEFSHDADDFDWTKYLSHKVGAPNLGFGGSVTLTVGHQPYEIMLRHKYRFNSSLNVTSSVKRMREQLGDFDVGCISHFHQAAVEQAIMGDGVDRVFIRPGSFKGSDRWSRSMGYSDAGAYIPTVVLYPDRRLMIPFLHLEQAILFMESL